MSNQWGRQPMGKDSRTLVVGVIIIGIIGYLLLPNFFKADPTVASVSLDNVNVNQPPSTYNPSIPNSSGNTVQTTPGVNNTLDSGNGTSKISTGYWILSVSNGSIQQFSVSAQVYAFLQGLINSDSKGTAEITVFLIDNGQIHQYVVSNEIYSVISNMATIETRASKAFPSSTPNTSPSSTPNASPSSTPNASPSSTPNVLP